MFLFTSFFLFLISKFHVNNNYTHFFSNRVKLLAVKRNVKRVFCLMGKGSDVPVFIIRGIQLKQLTRHDENDAFADIRHPVGCALKIMNDPEYLVGMVD